MKVFILMCVCFQLATTLHAGIVRRDVGEGYFYNKPEESQQVFTGYQQEEQKPVQYGSTKQVVVEVPTPVLAPVQESTNLLLTDDSKFPTEEQASILQAAATLKAVEPEQTHQDDDEEEALVQMYNIESSAAQQSQQEQQPQQSQQEQLVQQHQDYAAVRSGNEVAEQASLAFQAPAGIAAAVSQAVTHDGYHYERPALGGEDLDSTFQHQELGSQVPSHRHGHVHRLRLKLPHSNCKRGNADLQAIYAERSKRRPKDRRLVAYTENIVGPEYFEPQGDYLQKLGDYLGAQVENNV